MMGEHEAAVHVERDRDVTVVASLNEERAIVITLAQRGAADVAIGDVLELAAPRR